MYLFNYLLYSLFLLFFIIVQRLRTAHRRVDLAERRSSKLRCASECGKVEASSEVYAVEDGEAIGVKGFEDVARTIEGDIFREVLDVLGAELVKTGDVGGGVFGGVLV